MRTTSLPQPDDLGDPVAFTDPLHHQVHEFLVYEAEALDERRYRDWLAMLTDDVEYRMPVRVSSAGALATSLLDHMDHFAEDRYSLGKRVERFETDFAWTEDPPSRVRHIVTNVRATRTTSEDTHVRSYLLLFRSRGDSREAEYVAAERHDRLRPVAGGLRLARRFIVVDESVLRTQNLAIFL